MTFFNEKPLTLSEAIVDWNKKNLEKDRLKPGSKKTEEIGKSIFIRYSSNVGFWIEAKKSLNPFKKKPELPEFEKKQVAELLRTYKVAGEILNTKTSKVIEQLGSKIGRAYSLLMNPERDELAIEEISPELEQLVEMMNQKDSTLDFNKLPDDFKIFRQKLLNEAGLYAAKLHDNSLFRSIRESGLFHFKEADRINDFMEMFFNRFFDEMDIKLHLNAFQGQASDSANPLIDDLSIFLETRGKEFNSEERNRLATAIEALKFANSNYGSQYDKRTAEESALGVVKKLQEQAKLGLSDPILILGGCIKHTVLYRIQRVSFDPDKWSFTVINTGGGDHSYRVGKVSSRGVFEGHIKDQMIAGLTLEDLSEKFFVDLIRSKYELKTMNELYGLIEKSLLREGTQKVDGLSRVGQKKGTCAARCMDVWLQEILGEGLYREFDAFAAEERFKTLNKISKTISPIALKILFPSSGELADTKYAAEQMDAFVQAGRQAVEFRKRRIVPIVFT